MSLTSITGKVHFMTFLSDYIIDYY